MLTRLIRILLPLIFFVSIMGGVGGNNSAGSVSNATKAENLAHNGVVVELILRERRPKRLKFQVKVSNNGEKAVVIVTDPVRVDGSKGPYLSLNENNPALLELRFEVFAPPDYAIYAPKNRVTLKRLEPGETHHEDVVLDAPLNGTRPPWGEWQDTKPINIANIHQVIANVGVLPDDPAIHAVLVNVPSPQGLEMAEGGPLKGKPLFSFQTMVSSKIVKL